VALRSVVLKDQVPGVPDHAFSYCAWLTTIAFPPEMEANGAFALAECISLTSLTPPAGFKAHEQSGTGLARV
jgi:hypothetical protein